MNRTLTNKIRFVMDELIPPFIRDSWIFMWPFYYFAYGGRNIRQVMDFKKYVYQWNKEELVEFYSKLNSISRNRPTDISDNTIPEIIRECSGNFNSILDAGCGKGFLLNLLADKLPKVKLYGLDFVDANPGTKKYQFINGEVTSLPFEDKSIDIVICAHTIEHVLDLSRAIKELKRVARKKLILVTPRQKYFYYTLDEHVNFFPQIEPLLSIINDPGTKYQLIDGDWFIVIEFSTP
ncbi:MAG: class I SAM-dependent methyltransferase [Flavitalea sp.]